MQDDDADVWSDTTLLGYLNDGQRAVVLLKPNANVTNTAVQLAAGTKQSLPTGGMGPIKVTRNMGSDGSTAGDSITFVDMEQYNYLESDWHTETAAATVEVYMYDQNDPTHFYVAPPQPATPGYIELLYTATPTDVATTGTAITLNDIYSGLLVNYMLYRAYATEIDEISSVLSGKYYEMFLAELGGKERVEQTTRKR